MPNKTNVDILNSIRTDLSPEWQNVIPVLSRENFYQYGMALASEDLAPQANEALYKMFNKIGLTLFKEGNIKNRYNFLHTGNYELGDTVEEVVVGVTEGEEYQPFGDGTGNYAPGRDQYEKFPPKVDVMYHKRNRRMDYPITLSEEQYKAAMRNMYGLQQVTNMVMGTPYRNNTRDSEIFTKQMISAYRHKLPTGVAFQPTQFVRVPRPVDEDTCTNYYEKLQQIVLDVSFNSTAFNAKEHLTSTETTGLYYFVTKDILPTLNTRKLAMAYNPEYLTTTIPNEMHVFDDFGADDADGNTMSDVLGIICGKKTFQVLNNLLKMRTASNSRDLYDNYFLHIWETYMSSYFEPCVFILEE